MKSVSILAVALSVLAVGCGSKSPTAASNSNQVKFTAALLPANETTVVNGGDVNGRGTATIVLNLTKDSAGTITSATADFSMDLNSFPAGTVITAAHIHPGAAGQPGSALIGMGLVSGEIVLVNGTQTGITKTGQTGGGALTPAIAQDIINNPANYYFNVHTSISGSGAARGQLVKQ